MKDSISNSISYPLDKTQSITQRDYIVHMIKRDNHQLASDPANEPTLLKKYSKEVNRGCMLPIIVESVTNIKGAGVIPGEVVTQVSVNDKGDRITNRRTPHGVFSLHHQVVQ